MCHVNRDSLTHCSQGSVAQLVELRTSNLKVVGSDPTRATEIFNNSVGHCQCQLSSSLMLPEDDSNLVSYVNWLNFVYFLKVTCLRPDLSK